MENTLNDEYYEIERSAGGNNYIVIGKVFSNSSRNYQFIDKEVLTSGNPSLYYRLKVVTKSNHLYYSDILRFNLASAGSELLIHSVYPNPFTNNIGISITSPEKQLLVMKIIDHTGRVMYKANATVVSGSNLVDINNCTALSKGSYILEIVSLHQTYYYNILKL
jgi:hypothetical protein